MILLVTGAGPAFADVSADAAKKAGAAAAPAEVDASDACDGDPSVVEKWVRAHALLAKGGTRELVRIPLMRGSDDWTHNDEGDAPEEYVGSSSVNPCGEAWLELEYEPGLAPPPRRPSGAFEVVAEGYFTGRVGKRGRHATRQFHVLRWRSVHDDQGERLVAQVVLAGAHADDKVAALDDKKPWLVVVDSLPRFASSTAKRSAELARKLVAAGFAEASVIDSRSAKLLFCCYDVILAGRYATREEAVAVSKQVARKGFKDPYVRQGW
jgi:hypothetical protein